MYNMGIRHYKEVTKLIHTYYRNPEKAFEELADRHESVNQEIQ